MESSCKSLNVEYFVYNIFRKELVQHLIRSVLHLMPHYKVKQDMVI